MLPLPTEAVVVGNASSNGDITTAGLIPIAVDVGLALTVALPIAALLLGAWIFLDARERVSEELAPLIAIAVAGLLLAGSLPGVVALLVAQNPAVQGFPTALRIVPGLVALGVYFYVR